MMKAYENTEVAFCHFCMHKSILISIFLCVTFKNNEETLPEILRGSVKYRVSCFLCHFGRYS